MKAKGRKSCTPQTHNFCTHRKRIHRTALVELRSLLILRGLELHSKHSMNSHKSLPPDHHLSIPLSSRAASKAGLTLYAACTRPALIAQQLASLGVQVMGGKILPGKSTNLDFSSEFTGWSDLLYQWHDLVGDFDDFAVHMRRPIDRSGISLLLLDRGKPKAFIKLRPGDDNSLAREQQALDALAAENGKVETPSVLGAGKAEEWKYLAISPLPPEIHRIHRGRPDEVVADYSARLAKSWKRPEGVPSSWAPLHGDLTAWNLRTIKPNRAILFDWEDSGWGPPNADLLWYTTTSAIKGLRVATPATPPTEEVVLFWIDRLEESNPPERSLAGFVLRTLKSGETKKPRNNGGGMPDN